MKKILILLLFCGFWANAQQYHDKGAKFEFATNEGDTITVNTRIPIIDEFGLINYYVDVADLLALNPAPVLEWGNITGTLSNQTDLQGALNDKADQSALTAHTSNGNIHFTQSAISITESQVSDLKDYLRGDINDTNGANKLTLGSLEVVGQTTLQNGLNLTSIPTGTSNNILTINGTGDVEQRVFSLGDIDIANAAGVNQFPVGLGDQLRIQGSGDTSISFDGITNTININSTPGSGGGGAVTSFNGRDGAVVSQAGDYSTAMVNELTNLYFTEPRVRATPLTGLTISNTPISSTNTFLQALGRLQGQINDRYTKGESDGKYAIMNSTTLNDDDLLLINRNNDNNPVLYVNQIGNGDIAYFYKGSGVGSVSGTNQVTITNSGGITATGNITANNLSGTNTGDQTLSSLGGVPTSRTISSGTGLTGGGNLSSNRTISIDPAYGLTRVGVLGGNNGLFHLERDGSSTGQQVLYVNQYGVGNIAVFFKGSSSGATSGADMITFDNNANIITTGMVTGSNLKATGTSRVAGSFYAGTTNPISTTRLNYDGHLFVSELTSIGDVTANSDKRLKKNIKRIDNALAIVQLLGGYEYDRKDIDLHQAGVIAQEVEEVFPTAVSEDKKGIKSVAYNQLIALLIEAVKEQQIEIENLKTLINEK